MRAVTIKEAKAHLNELVEAATVGGEQVVLMRGSKHVAALVPISDSDIELGSRLSDDQAARLWRSLADEHTSNKQELFPSVEAAVAFLKTPARRAPRSKKRPGAR